MSVLNVPSKPLSKAEVNRVKPGDVHNILSRHILADGFDVVYDMVRVLLPTAPLRHNGPQHHAGRFCSLRA